MAFDISNDSSNKIALSIQKQFYKPLTDFKTSIFLCGADLNNKEKIRYKIGEALSSGIHKYYFDLVFPEDIFEEILYSRKGKDLLSLENLLAESIDVILLIPESPGSFAELGAFANDSKLRKKLICIIDQKYRKDKSFINQGPIKLIKKSSSKNAIFIDPDHIGIKFPEITAGIRRVKKNSTVNNEKISLLQIDKFLLPTIFLLEPVNINVLVKIVESVVKNSKNTLQIVMTALSMLTKKKEIELNNNEYRLTRTGFEEHFNKKVSGRYKMQKETIGLDNMRLEILNLRLRNKELKI